MITADLRLDNREDMLAQTRRSGAGCDSLAGRTDRADRLGKIRRCHVAEAARSIRRGDLGPAQSRSDARPRSSRPQRGDVAQERTILRLRLHAKRPVRAARCAARVERREIRRLPRAQSCRPCDARLYRHVFRLPPAHVAKVAADGSMVQHRYWSTADIKPVRLASDQAYADGLRECLDRAVRRQMRSAHPIGSHLSGGLDCSSVSALAARALG